MAEVEFLRDRLAAEKKLTDEARGLIAVLEQRIGFLEKSIEQYKIALAKSEQIETVDSRLIQSYEKSLTDAKAEIARLTTSRNLWRGIAAVGIVTTAVVAGLFGFLLGSR